MDKEFLLQQGLSEEGADAVLQVHQQTVTDYEQRIAAMGADHALRQAVTAAGGRNLTAIRALVDEAAIAASEDMSAAAKAAVEALRRESPYLFAVPQVYAPGTGTAPRQTGRSMEELGKLSLAEYRRYRKGN